MRFLSAFAIAFVFAAVARAADLPDKHWPRWRGAGADASAAGQYPAQWSDTDNVAWKVALPGKGCSSPIVWGERIVITGPIEGGQDAVLAFDFTGKELWRTSVGKTKDGKHRNGSSSNPSAVTNGKHVFAYFKSGVVAGLDMNGKLLWSTNLQERFGDDTLFWDIGTSPVLTQKHVIVAVMHKGESFLAAFDHATGDLAWKVARNYECPIEGDHSYATPIIIDHKGKEAILVWGAEHLTAHDAADGKLIWSCGGFNVKQNKFWVAVASHLVVGDMAIVPYGRGAHLVGVKLGGEGDVTATHRAWERNDVGAFVPTPCAAGGKVYVVGDRGEVACLDAKTGEPIWKDKLPKNSASYYASPVIAGDKLYATREDGVIYVAKIDGKFELLSENIMNERIIATPVPIAGKVLIRGERHLFCIGAK